ncbi:MAG: phosphatase PAP2 family protein [Candidatus Zixiibacteriota bacterium]
MNSARTVSLSRGMEIKKKIEKIIFFFRFEEFVAILFLAPVTYFTLKAFLFFQAQGDVPRRFSGGVARLVAVLIALGIAWLIAKYKPEWRLLRDGLPFGYAIAIYTNLHDTVHFVNPHDVHNILIRADAFLFGVQPCVWAEKFIHPYLTTIFSFCYAMYLAFAPIVALVLYLQKRYKEFRYTLVSVIFCFYLGYFGYILFPAAPPRYTLLPQFTRSLHGPLLDASMKLINVFPSTSRCAFPSLHSAITVLSLLFAFKYLRWFFWTLLPFGVGLLLATIYLRHHYVVDLLAGFVLCGISFWLGPKTEDFWSSKVSRLGGKTVY